MNPDPNNIIVPDESQLRVLDRVRSQLTAMWPTTDVKHEKHFQHWEDESLDIPPLGESAWFRVSLPKFEVTISTPLPWEPDPTGRIHMSFGSSDNRQSEPCALILDEEARHLLAELGIEAGRQARSWSLKENTEPEIVEAVVDGVRRIATVPVRILRRSDLPSNADWPRQGLLALMTADKIVSIENDLSGEAVVTVETAGRRTVAEVTDKEMQLLRWWWDRAGASLPNKEPG